MDNPKKYIKEITILDSVSMEDISIIDIVGFKVLKHYFFYEENFIQPGNKMSSIKISTVFTPVFSTQKKEDLCKSLKKSNSYIGSTIFIKKSNYHLKCLKTLF